MPRDGDNLGDRDRSSPTYARVEMCLDVYADILGSERAAARSVLQRHDLTGAVESLRLLQTELRQHPSAARAIELAIDMVLGRLRFRIDRAQAKGLIRDHKGKDLRISRRDNLIRRRAAQLPMRGDSAKANKLHREFPGISLRQLRRIIAVK